MDRQQFFRELCTVLGREGFTTQPEQDDLSRWNGTAVLSAESQRVAGFATGKRMWPLRNGTKPVSEPPIWPAWCRST